MLTVAKSEDRKFTHKSVLGVCPWKFYRANRHNNYRIFSSSSLFLTLCLSIFLMELGGVRAVEQGSSGNEDTQNGDFGSSGTAILASVGVFMCGFTFVALCSFRWFRLQFRKLCPKDPPNLDDDPIAVFEGSYGSTNTPGATYINHSYNQSPLTLDPSTLARDHNNSNLGLSFDREFAPVEIEPLPNPSDILSGRSSGSRYDLTEIGDARLSFDSLQSTGRPTIISDPADQFEDPNIFAQDWFSNESLLNQFPRSNVDFFQEIGQGWFGLVIESEATDVPLIPFPRRVKVMVKMLREEASKKEQMKFLDEVRVYRDSNHKNILKLLGYSIDTSGPFLVILEHYPRGDLKAFLTLHSNVTLNGRSAASSGDSDEFQGAGSQPSISLKNLNLNLMDSRGAHLRGKMALDIANGLHWMHDNGFVHQDLAARNCLVGNEGQILIGDYGLSRSRYRDDYYWSGSASVPIRWCAPESLQCSTSTIKTMKLTKEANIWTFAVLLWEICELAKYPYAELSDEEVLQRVIVDRNYTLKHPTITTLPYVTLRDKMASIMSSCWHPIASKRANIKQVVDMLMT